MPIAGYYWPDELKGPDASTVVGWVRLFKSLGYTVCDTAELEPGFEKVAIYISSDATVRHVAHQLESGAWTSKLGKWEDIQDWADLAVLSAEEVIKSRVLKRPRSSANQDADSGDGSERHSH